MEENNFVLFRFPIPEAEVPPEPEEENFPFPEVVDLLELEGENLVMFRLPFPDAVVPLEPEEVNLPKDFMTKNDLMEEGLLQKLCVQKAAERLKSHAYCNIDYLLNREVSDMLFNNIHIPHVSMDFKLSMEIQKKFNVSNVTLGRNNYRYTHRELVYKQESLLKLELLELKESDMFLKPTERDGKKKIGRPHLMNIVGVIKRFVCPKSRPLLKALALGGKEVAFKPGWLEQLHNLLPSITDLDLKSCHLTDEQFRDLCQLYSNMKKLSIGQTDVHNLAGIEFMKKLEFLSLEDLDIRTSIRLNNVLLLENLKVLDVSSSKGGAKTAQLLSKCRRTLPNLKFLDCSGNFLCPDIIRKLLEIHSELMQMSVINTAFDRLSQAEFLYLKENVQFNTIADLDSCNKSLTVHLSNAIRCKTILDRVLHFMKHELSFQEKQEILDCCERLVGVLKNPNQSFENQIIAIQCFEIILKKKVIDEIITGAEMQDIVRATTIAMLAAKWKTHSCPGYMVVQSGMNSVLRLLKSERSIRSYVAIALKRLLLNCKSNFEKVFLTSCSAALDDCKEFLAIRKYTVFELDELMMQWWGDSSCGRTNSDTYKLKIGIFTLLLSVETENSRFYDIPMKVILSSLKENKQHVGTIKNCFKCLEIMYPRMEEEESDIVFDAKYFGTISDLVTGKNSDNSHAAICFLLAIHKFHIDCYAPFLNQPYEPYSNQELTRRYQVAELNINLWGSFLEAEDNVFAKVRDYGSDDDIRIWASWIHFKQQNAR